MSEIPRPIEAETVVSTIPLSRDRRKFEASVSEVDDALIKRRVEIRNNMRSLFDRCLGIKKMGVLDMWKEEWERIDEKALELVKRGVIIDFEEAKRVATDERFQISSSHVDFDERGKMIGNEILYFISNQEISKSVGCYRDGRSKPELMDVGRGYVDREAVRAVKKGLVHLLEEGLYGAACEVFYEWLFLVRVAKEDLEKVPVSQDQIDGFKKAVQFDLADALEIHPHIFVMKKNEIVEAGLLKEGEAIFGEAIRLAVRAELSKALARNNEYFEELRDYYNEEGLIGAYVDVEPDESEHERSTKSVRAHFSAVWEEFLNENSYFRDLYKKQFELNPRR